MLILKVTCITRLLGPLVAEANPCLAGTMDDMLPSTIDYPDPQISGFFISGQVLPGPELLDIWIFGIRTKFSWSQNVKIIK